MRRVLMPLLLALAIPVIPTAPAQAAACAGADTMPAAATLTKVRTATLCLLNQQRRAHGLPALRNDVRLQRAATGFSRDMVRHQFFDHTAPDGATFAQRIVSAGYDSFRALAENIAWGSGGSATPEQIVDGWMQSTGHRRNILDGSLHDIGIGIARGAPQAVAASAAATYTTDFGARR